MKHVVITGSTRGIGLGMAEQFLTRGCSVTISGRAQADVDKVVQALSSRFDAQAILGVACDVTQADQVQKVWQASLEKFGKVDIWINNAGISHPPNPLWKIDNERLQAVLDTNILGLMLGCKVAISGMLEQGYGHIYNMEGSGSTDSPRPRLVLYQTTKRALSFVSEGLRRELKGSPVMLSNLSPGMVVTDLLTEGYEAAELARVKRFFNILADKVETVAPFLVEGILNNHKNGARIAWLTTPKAIGRFLSAPFKRRDLFA
jgi:short-subunit dehydrogenase